MLDLGSDIRSTRRELLRVRILYERSSNTGLQSSTLSHCEGAMGEGVGDSVGVDCEGVGVGYCICEGVEGKR